MGTGKEHVGSRGGRASNAVVILNDCPCRGMLTAMSTAGDRNWILFFM